MDQTQTAISTDNGAAAIAKIHFGSVVLAMRREAGTDVVIYCGTSGTGTMTDIRTLLYIAQWAECGIRPTGTAAKFLRDCFSLMGLRVDDLPTPKIVSVRASH
jgi:hypothetical protein